MAAPPITERHLHHFHRRSPIKEPVRFAATGNITISTGLNAGDTIDGGTLIAGDRVLLPVQSTGSQNGIWIAGVTPVRAYDQSTDDPAYGFVVLALEGTANAGTLWQNTNISTPTIDTTALTFELVSSGSGGGGASPTDTGAWVPVMDGLGNVVTDGFGQAVMTFVIF